MVIDDLAHITKYFKFNDFVILKTIDYRTLVFTSVFKNSSVIDISITNYK
jgi:hypothetical protein